MVKQTKKNSKTITSLSFKYTRTRFYGNNDSKAKNIKGMTIGLAMNSVYYYQKEKMEKHIVKIR